MEVFQDQAEWYTLELAAALATQRAARSTAAEYLAWCPAHGHGGMRALMATTPPGTEHDALRMLRVGALGSEWLIQIMVLMACRVARYITSTAQHILLVCYQTPAPSIQLHCERMVVHGMRQDLFLLHNLHISRSFLGRHPNKRQSHPLHAHGRRCVSGLGWQGMRLQCVGQRGKPWHRQVPKEQLQLGSCGLRMALGPAWFLHPLAEALAHLFEHADFGAQQQSISFAS